MHIQNLRRHMKKIIAIAFLGIFIASGWAAAASEPKDSLGNTMILKKQYPVTPVFLPTSDPRTSRIHRCRNKGNDLTTHRTKQTDPPDHRKNLPGSLRIKKHTSHLHTT